jgi:TRAP-type uncharacterized transport system substrate-binding protein
MKIFSMALPFWVRAVLLAGVVFITLGAGLATYRYYERPTTLTIAVGSLDGAAGQAASIIAGYLVTSDASVRLKVEKSSNVLDAAKAFAAGDADLAVVRADVGDLSQARSVALVAHGAVLIVAPPGSTITGIEKLKGRTVGVVGGDVNKKIVEVLTKQYDLARANVVFRNLAPEEVRGAVQAREVSAILLVIPLTEKYLSLVRGLFRGGPNSSPVLIPIDSAGAIAELEGAYESFDIPKGTLRGAPAVPDDDVTTLRVGFYLVANKKLDSNLIGTLTKRVMGARRDLVAEQPLLSEIAAPDVDPDAFIPVHPGAAAFYNGTEQSFMDKYGNEIYLTPMILGAMASVFAAAWRFLGFRQSETRDTALGTLDVLPRRIRRVENEDELARIEEEVDDFIGVQLAKSVKGDEDALEVSTLILAAHRLDNLIHHRRAMFTAQTSPSRNG